MTRKTLETAKMLTMAACTVLTFALMAFTHSLTELPMAAVLLFLTGYFAWKRTTCRDEPRTSVRDAAPTTTCERPTTAQRVTIGAVVASLGLSGLALGWMIANFDGYSHAFIAQHGGTTTGVALGLGVRCLTVVGWAAAAQRFGRYLQAGGRRALLLVASWAVVTAVGYGALALRDVDAPLVTFDVVRALLGAGAGLALLVPSVRRGLAAHRAQPAGA